MIDWVLVAAVLALAAYGIWAEDRDIRAARAAVRKLKEGEHG